MCVCKHVLWLTCHRNFGPGDFGPGGPKSPILFHRDLGSPDHNHQWFWSDSSYLGPGRSAV